jgi:hypothetical protein
MLRRHNVYASTYSKYFTAMWRACGGVVWVGNLQRSINSFNIALISLMLLKGIKKRSLSALLNSSCWPPNLKNIKWKILLELL